MRIRVTEVSEYDNAFQWNSFHDNEALERFLRLASPVEVEDHPERSGRIMVYWKLLDKYDDIPRGTWFIISEDKYGIIVRFILPNRSTTVEVIS